ncbi:MAG: GspH/FimT family pseudopilin [Pseudomonadota bacterium]|nr:MAG: GspH/FimT family pseudopilin [Pseudomonadota bacterium]
MAIATATGAPALDNLLASNRISASVNNLSAHLAYTRSEAITRNAPVMLCKSSDGQGCTGAANWHDGWIVFQDLDGDRDRNEDEPLLRVQQRVGTLEIRYRGFRSSNWIEYRPSGYTEMNGTFTICDPSRSELARAVILYKTGRVRASKHSADGGALPCGGEAN